MLKWFRSLADIFKKEPLTNEGSSLCLDEGGYMWLFVGLGNPGGKYAKNRHNIGFMAIDAMADGAYKSKFQGLIHEMRLSGQKVLLLKPQTYMNNSGQSVKAVAQFYKIPVDKIMVFHDELDIDAGDVRIKQGGGNAGHNGLKSIQAHMGSADFWRVRIGIGRPAHKNAVSNYVLSDFSKAEQEWLVPLLDCMGSAADVVVSESPKSYEKIIKEKGNKNGI